MHRHVACCVLEYVGHPNIFGCHCPLQGDDVKALLCDATPLDIDSPPSSAHTTKATVANKGLTVAGGAVKGFVGLNG